MNLGHAGLGSAALLPLHLADPPLPGPGLPPRAAVRDRRATRPRRAPARWPRRREWTSVARARRDGRSSATPTTSRAAFLLERALSRGRLRRACFEGEVVGADRRRRLRRVRRRLRGAAARAAPARRLVGAQRARHDPRGRRDRARRSASATRSRVRVGRIDVARGRVDLAPVDGRRGYRLTGHGQGQASEVRRRATWRRNRQASLPLRVSRQGRVRHRAAGNRGQVAARRRLPAEGRLRAIKDGELWLHNVHIPPYAPAHRENHEPERPRKLLAHRREIERLVGKIHENGLTLVPTRIYFNGPRAKVEIALAKGKDRFDKRDSIKAPRYRARRAAPAARRGPLRRAWDRGPGHLSHPRKLRRPSRRCRPVRARARR